jgi:hypothetical protein
VSAAAGGGWDITATVDGHVVAARHAGDWHRTERMCRRLEDEVRRRELVDA